MLAGSSIRESRGEKVLISTLSVEVLGDGPRHRGGDARIGVQRKVWTVLLG